MQIAVLITFLTYLGLFFLAGRVTAQEAGRSIWLFGAAKGRAHFAAIGFRAAFILAGIAVLLNVVLHEPQILHGPRMALAVLGVFMANLGAMIGFAAQLSMGTSWRVGVQAGTVGALVKGGIYRFSRNPTFLGQGLLLAGLFLTVPSLLTFTGLALFIWSAHTQVAYEEALLEAEHGADYTAFKAEAPRWL